MSANDPQRTSEAQLPLSRACEIADSACCQVDRQREQGDIEDEGEQAVSGDGFSDRLFGGSRLIGAPTRRL